jgi:hypothetical protein
MGQVYLHSYRYKGVLKSEIDKAWGVALEAFAKTGNFGNVESAGIRHIKGYGTGWGGHVLIEVDDPRAFDRYQLFCNQNYGHAVDITMEPLFDTDAALADTIAQLKK